MKFTSEVIVSKPRDQVVGFFSNPAYLKNYQDTFLRKVLISGEEGQTGAVSKLYYKMGKGEMELTETITKNALPNTFEGQYHHKHTDNSMHTTFTVVNENMTKVTSVIEYTAFRGFIIRLITFVYPKLFKKQVDKWLQNFKDFVEDQ